MNETPTVMVFIGPSHVLRGKFYWVVYGPAPKHKRMASGTSETREGAQYAATMEARLIVPDFTMEAKE